MDYSVYSGTLPKLSTDLEQLNVRSSIHDVIFTTLFFFDRLSRIAFTLFIDKILYWK
ncbi:hypothetical protein VAE151_560417 [Vibrio aestuarianus]|nr:hypothetical protein VAEU17_220056 [Vibrio aestuarianus]CAH8204623.1 hypothetical protein VIBAE_A31657 [Vibrio aestuarianus subsp. francensis]CAH8205335.1 hypothetical protein VAE032_271057 [Vibrio aestuarianus]CAH8205520.1 hypothetical protein VAE128_461063 [Vibrio aestuarianus]CAH8206049.1 hypothetical protein VAE115_321060 [Vibrio aestuarianus]